MGLSPGDLTAAPRDRAAVPTFADYVPVVSAAVTDGTRKAYGSYWNRVVEQWGARRLDEPTPSNIRHLMTLVKAGAVQRRNSRRNGTPEGRAAAALRHMVGRRVPRGDARPARSAARVRRRR